MTTRTSRKPLDPTAAAAHVLSEQQQVAARLDAPTRLQIADDMLTAARDAEHHNARLAVESDHLLPGMAADLDLVEHLVCGCNQSPCPRRDVVARIRARFEAVERLAREWQAESATRSTPEHPDTILSEGAARMVLHSLGIPKEDR